MSDQPICAVKKPVKRKLARLMIVLAGIVLGQAILYGPSLAGRKILLPLDILAAPAHLPTPDIRSGEDRAHNNYPDRLDLPLRTRAALWGVGDSCGPVADVGALSLCRSSFHLAQVLALSGPAILHRVSRRAGLDTTAGRDCGRLGGVPLLPARAGSQLLAGGDCLLVLPADRVFRLLARAIPPACRCIGFPGCCSPWTKRREARVLAPVGLSVVTCLVLVSGHLDVAAQVLLASGLYALWCLHGRLPQTMVPAPGQEGRAGACGWLGSWDSAGRAVYPAGFGIHAHRRPHGARSAGSEERPPVGLTALPQTVLPDMYGSVQTGSLRFTGNMASISQGRTRWKALR